jgi:hypothetical protein
MQREEGLGRPSVVVVVVVENSLYSFIPIVKSCK